MSTVTEGGVRALDVPGVRVSGGCSMASPLDRNKTVWQRLNEALHDLVDPSDAERITRGLHAYVVAEKDEALLDASQRVRALVPLAMDLVVGVVSFDHRRTADVAGADQVVGAVRERHPDGAVLDGAEVVGHGHDDSPSIGASGPDSRDASSLIVGDVPGMGPSAMPGASSGGAA